MNRTQYVQKVREIAQESPAYRSGGDGSDGTCDCVGLGIGALRRGGVTYKSLHGTNWAARNEAVNLRRIKGVDELRVGDNVLKAHEPGEIGYALPDRYQNDDDQRDYYHMGVVVSASPLVILHCTTPTVKTDRALGKWRYAFSWKQIEAEEGGTDTMADGQAVYCAVVATRRDPLALRNAPEGDRIGKLPRGATVSVLAENGGWAYVTYGGVSGYCSAAYLTRCEPEAGQETKESRTHAALLLTDSAGNTWTPVGDFSVRRVAVEGESLGADTLE